MKPALIAALISLIAGCSSLPSGVEMSQEEAAECASSGCTVWSVRELQELARKAWTSGYAHGKASI